MEGGKICGADIVDSKLSSDKENDAVKTVDKETYAVKTVENELVKEGGEDNKKSLKKQLLCSLAINLVSLLQGASVPTSSVILHNLQRGESSPSAVQLQGEEPTSSIILNILQSHQNKTELKDLTILQNIELLRDLTLVPYSELKKDLAYKQNLTNLQDTNLTTFLQTLVSQDLATLEGPTTLQPVWLFSDFSVTQEEGSWIASSWVLGHLVSACFAGFLNDQIGRKKSLLIDTAVFFVGFLMLATSQTTGCLVTARLLLGYPLVSQVYLCEVVSPHRRGLSAAMYSVLHSTGFFLMLMLGAFFPWRYTVMIPALLAVPTFIAICFLEESPDWLLKMGREDKYRRALKFYHLSPPCPCPCPSPKCPKLEAGMAKEENGSVLVEVVIMSEKNKSEKEMGHFPWKWLNPIERTLALSLKTFLRPLQQNKNFVPTFFYLAVTFFCMGWCGFSILSFYAVEVFQKSGSPLSASHTSWLTSITKIICAMMAFYVLHNFKRKTLFLVTGSLVCLAFLTMGLYTYLSKTLLLQPYVSQSLNFIPMLCVILAYTGYGLGYNVLPSLMAAEMMPVQIRSSVIGVLMALEMSSTFLLSKLKPVLMDYLGIHGLFTMFAGIVFLVIVITAFAMPNQKQKR